MGKKKVGFWIDATMADKLDAMSEKFDGLKGELVSAALQLFFEAKPDVQREALKEIMDAKVDRLFSAAESSRKK